MHTDTMLLECSKVLKRFNYKRVSWVEILC